MTHFRLVTNNPLGARWFVALVAALCLSVGHLALAGEIPAEQTALLVLKVLGYDQNIATRTESDKVLVLFKEGDGRSEARSRELLESLQEATSKYRVQGKALTAQAVGIQTPDDVETALAEGAAALFLCPGLDGERGTILKATADHDILSFTGTEDLFDSGVGVGLVLEGTRPKLLVNLPTVLDEGASLDASFLGVADVRR